MTKYVVSTHNHFILHQMLLIETISNDWKNQWNESEFSINDSH